MVSDSISIHSLDPMLFPVQCVKTNRGGQLTGQNPFCEDVIPPYDAQVDEFRHTTTGACRETCGYALGWNPFARNKVHADKDYDFAHCRAALHTRGLAPRLTRRGVENEERLGHHWVVEDARAPLVARFRRLQVRNAWRQDIR